jgi:TRAP-type transport system periplasmic protein
MKRQTLRLLTIILVTLILVMVITSACTKQTSTTPVTEPNLSTTAVQLIKLRMGTGSPASDPKEVLNQRWIEKIQKETNGRIQITLYPGSTLIDQMGAWDELLAGVADIAQCSLTIGGTPFTISKKIATFFFGTDLIGARKAYEALWKKFPELSAEFKNAKLLYVQGGAGIYAITKKPVRTLNDFNGLQLDPPLDYPDLAGKLGATGSVTPIMELYTALDKGILDGVFFGADALNGLNLADVVQYSTNLHKYTAPPNVFYAMNLDTWNNLSPDIQKVIEDSIPSMETEIDQTLLQMEQTAIDWAKAKGHQFIELPPEDLNKIYGFMEEDALKQAAELDTQGIRGTEIFKEARRVIEEYNAKNN